MSKYQKVDPTKFKFGLIGKSLNHSYSADYFKNKWTTLGITNRIYERIELADPAQVKAFLERQKNNCGFNVTIPYKEVIWEMMDELSSTALEIGAVNCIVFNNGKWIGHNTDGIAFSNSLTNFLDGEVINHALVLGTGGASKAICWALKKHHIQFDRVSSSGKGISYEELCSMNLDLYRLIVNTTFLGMFPQLNACPNLPFDQFGEQNFAYDLIYNPLETIFLQKFKERGAKIKNGMEMLYTQADLSEAFWEQHMNR